MNLNNNEPNNIVLLSSDDNKLMDLLFKNAKD